MSQPSFDPGYLRAHLADLGSLMEQSRALGETLRDSEFRRSSENEDVTATVTGLGVLRTIEISTLAKRRLDNQTLGEQVAQAINRAIEAATEGRTELLSGLQLNGTSVNQILADVQQGKWPGSR